jgi:hypothetical protein
VLETAAPNMLYARRFTPAVIVLEAPASEEMRRVAGRGLLAAGLAEVRDIRILHLALRDPVLDSGRIDCRP